MDPRVVAAVEIMRTDFHTNVHAAAVAGRVGLSESRFRRLFKKEIGETWTAYLKRIRLSRAMELLGDSGLSIKLIAFRVGYNNPANFTRAFKAAFGESPRTFRMRRPTSSKNSRS